MKRNKATLPSRLKELRRRAGLTQEELAREAKVPYTTLIKVESGVIKNPSIGVIAAVSKALGVEMESIAMPVTVLQGKNAVSQVLDDVYESLKASGGEVLISGVDEKKFLVADKKAITSHIKRLAENGITEKILVREGDSTFFPGQQSLYRWIPERLFTPTPIYVYGNKVAMIVWGPPEQIIIIQNPALADAYRKQFLLIWETAKIPPTRTESEDDRIRLAKGIAARLGGRVSSITDKDRQISRKFLAEEKTQTYGNSFYYICQAANGLGPERLGLKYFDGETLIALGIFNRKSLGGGWHYFMNRPLGKFDPKKLLGLSKIMLELSGHPVYVKKVTTEQKEKLLDAGFSSIESYPWHVQAMEEDDTFPEQIIDVQSVLHTIDSPGKRNLKNQYEYFLNRLAGRKIAFANLDTTNTKDAYALVGKFFDYLDIKELHISQPTDYDNIILHPPLGKNGNTHFSQIMYVDGKPAAFFAMEPISKDTAGLYANITLHEEFPAISEYLVAQCCRILKSAGYRYLNLGGSETSGLFQFKEKFSPVAYNKMHWVVYRYE